MAILVNFIILCVLLRINFSFLCSLRPLQFSDRAFILISGRVERVAAKAGPGCRSTSSAKRILFLTMCFKSINSFGFVTIEFFNSE